MHQQIKRCALRLSGYLLVKIITTMRPEFITGDYKGTLQSTNLDFVGHTQSGKILEVCSSIGPTAEKARPPS